MKLRTLEDTDVYQKTVLYRSAYDIGVKQTAEGDYEIKDDSRIRASLKTLEYLIKNQCKIVIVTFVKRPDGKIVEGLRTTPHARALSELLGRSVKKADDCVGEKVRKMISDLQFGELLMLENTRFHPEEMVDDDAFAKQLTRGCNVVVFDGFPQAHRVHASTTGILRHLPSCSGFYLQSEVEALCKLMNAPERPFTIVIGGEKISDKIDAINNLYDVADTILVGGGVANVFMKTKGIDIGTSFVEDVFVDLVKKEKKDWVEYAAKILERGDKVRPPVDLVVGDNLDKPKKTKIAVTVPVGWAALDIGPLTVSAFSMVIGQSKTVFWNGPMGVFEDERFADGSRSIAKAMEQVSGLTVIAGGDTIEAAKKFCDVKKITHLSLAGGATLEFLAGKKLPVLEMLGVYKKCRTSFH